MASPPWPEPPTLNRGQEAPSRGRKASPMDFISLNPQVFERNLRGNLIHLLDAQAQQLVSELLQAMQSPRDEAEALWSRANSFVLVSRETLDQLGVLQRIEREVVGVSLPQPESSGEAAFQSAAARMAALEQAIKTVVAASGAMSHGAIDSRELTRELRERLGECLPMVLEVEKGAYRLQPRSAESHVVVQWGERSRTTPDNTNDSVPAPARPAGATATSGEAGVEPEGEPPGRHTYERMLRTAAFIDSLSETRKEPSGVFGVWAEQGIPPERQTQAQQSYLMLKRVAAIIDGVAAREGVSWLVGASHDDPFELLDAKTFAERMDATDQTVYNTEKAGRLISVLPPGRQRHRRYPAFQLSPRLDKALHVKAIELYRQHGQDMTKYWDFLRTRHKDLGGSTGVDFLLGNYAHVAFNDLTREDRHAIFISLAEEDMSRAAS